MVSEGPSPGVASSSESDDDTDVSSSYRVTPAMLCAYLVTYCKHECPIN